MIGYDLSVKIRHLKEQEGLGLQQIADEPAINVRTIRSRQQSNSTRGISRPAVLYFVNPFSCLPLTSVGHPLKYLQIVCLRIGFS
jgi:hypothetical protein